MRRSAADSHSTLANTRDGLWQKRIRLEREFEYAREALNLDLGDWLSRSRIPEWLLRAVGLWNRGVRNALTPALVEHTLHISDLPEFLVGFRLLHLTDLHFREDFPEFAWTARDLLAGAEADICLFTGDYRYSQRGPSDHVFRDMEIVLEGIRCKHGIWGGLGNHDLSSFVEPFTAMGIRMLVNENQAVDMPEGRFWIAGVDDHHRYYCDSLALATEGIPRGEFSILLAHSPELAIRAASYGVSFYLCGHTHWGQVRFPGIGAVTYNSRCPARFCKGVWENGTMIGYTSPGIGATDLPIRFNCPPEATVFTLLRA